MWSSGRRDMLTAWRRTQLRIFTGPADAWALRVALGASALVGISALAARRVDVGSLAQTDVVWGWIVASLLLNLASVAGKAIVWKAVLAFADPAYAVERGREAFTGRPLTAGRERSDAREAAPSGAAASGAFRAGSTGRWCAGRRRETRPRR